jgi:diguanylate cyclase (GGDEF)-like protein
MQESVFSFETEEVKVGAAQPLVPAASPTAESISSATESPDLFRRSLEAIDAVTYHWLIDSDEIHWSPNLQQVLECPAAAATTGRAFAALLDADNMTSRYDTVMRSHAADDGNGVPFQIEYLFRPDGREGKRAIWLEDQGRWFAGADGRPAEVYGAIRRIDDRHIRDQHLSFLGNCDPLTGMMNRGRLAEALGETISMATREQSQCAFLIAAVNNLSVVNEAYGFEVADDVIVALARRLRHVVRTGDAIARYSGSKFGIILNNCDEADLAVAVDRFINIARESVIETDRGPVWAMLSIGAVSVPQHATDANIAMARAEEALTEARRLPSDGGVIYRPSAQRTAERNLNARCATEIVKCLKEDQFKLAFQPIVDARTHELVMHEALLRMTDADNELIAAAHLIPVAEKLGLVRLIDRRVAHMAIARLHDYPQAHLTMNVSGATATDPRWFNQLTEIIAANEHVASRLTVEITETVALGNMKQTFNFVETLRNYGCGVAIDDFGAGFTSFRNLRDLPVNIIKLDGTFCRNLPNNAANQYLVRTLIELGHKFNLKVIGEWVETQEDLEILTKSGVDYLQGNLFGAASLNLPWAKSGDSAFDNFAAASPQIAPVMRPSELVTAPVAAAGQLFEAVEHAVAHVELAPEESRRKEAAAVELASTLAEADATAGINTALPPDVREEAAWRLPYEDEIDNNLLKLRSILNGLGTEMPVEDAPQAAAG